MRNVSDKSCRENQNANFFCSETFFSNNLFIYEKMSQKSGGATGTTGNMAHAHCMLDKQGYTRESTRPHLSTHTHTHARTRMHSPTRAHKPTEICNIYCFYTATVVFVNASQCYYIRTLPVLL
jgi:hypothetical protein